jgi:hypothetical protein
MPQIPQATVSVLRDTDAFRLTIRALALVEEVLHEVLTIALPGGATWAEKLPFARKLDLIIALDVIPPASRRGFSELAKLRNEYAHTASPGPLTVERVDRLIDAWSELLPSIVNEPPPQPPADRTGEPLDRLLAGLLTPSAEVAKLQRACWAAVHVATWARGEAQQILDDRAAGRRNRLFREYVDQRRAAAAEPDAP